MGVSNLEYPRMTAICNLAMWIGTSMSLGLISASAKADTCPHGFSSAEQGRNEGKHSEKFLMICVDTEIEDEADFHVSLDWDQLAAFIGSQSIDQLSFLQLNKFERTEIVKRADLLRERLIMAEKRNLKVEQRDDGPTYLIDPFFESRAEEIKSFVKDIEAEIGTRAAGIATLVCIPSKIGTMGQRRIEIRVMKASVVGDPDRIMVREYSSDGFLLLGTISSVNDDLRERWKHIVEL